MKHEMALLEHSSMSEYGHLAGLQTTSSPLEGFRAIDDTPMALQRICHIQYYLPALINMSFKVVQRREGKAHTVV